MSAATPSFFRRRSRGAVVIAICLLCGCASSEPPPDIPVVSLDGFSDAAAETISDALEAVRAEPEDAALNGRLGMILHVYERFDPAVACYRRAQAFDPQDPRWHYYTGRALRELGQLDEALASFRDAIRLQPDSTASSLQLAETQLTAGLVEEAQRGFRAVADQYPDRPAAQFGLGRARTQSGDPQGAVAALSRAVELAPDAGAVHYALAQAYRALGESERAAPHFTVVESGNRDWPPVSDPWMAEMQGLRRDQHWHLNEALRLEAQGEFDNAERSFLAALELDPDYAQAHINLVSLYGKTRRFEEADQHYQRGLELAPEMADLHNNWGILQMSRGRPRRAAESFQRALEANANSPDTHANLGAALDGLGRSREAQEHFRNALAAQPNHRMANFLLGRALVAEGRVEEGIERLLFTQEPQDGRTPTYLYTLANAYARAGDLDQALTYARRTVSLAVAMNQPQLAERAQEEVRRLDAERRGSESE